MHGGVSDTLVIVDALFAQPKPAPHTGQITRDLPVISLVYSYLTAEKNHTAWASKHRLGLDSTRS